LLKSNDSILGLVSLHSDFPGYGPSMQRNNGGDDGGSGGGVAPAAKTSVGEAVALLLHVSVLATSVRTMKRYVALIGASNQP
jgi:hypothetical protein